MTSFNSQNQFEEKQSIFLPDIENENEFRITDESSSNSIFPNLGNLGFENDNLPNDFSMLYFSNSILHSEEEEEKELKKLYYIEENEKRITINKKRGRGRKGALMQSKKIHDKYSNDNLLRKIQIHYINFIVDFVNDILENLKYEQRFFRLKYKMKKNVNNENIKLLKQQSIGELLCNKISLKYRKKDENSNKKVYEIIKQDSILNKILSENYLKLFKKIYYKSNKIINLKEYGLDKNIVFSKNVKMFKDLLKNNQSFDKDKEYIKNINECVAQNYIPDLKFLCQ
jgi:hypothetical protein